VYGAAWQRVATNANRFAFAKSDLLVRDFSSGHMDPIYLPMPTGLPQLVIVHDIRSFRIARNKSPFQGMTMAIVCVLVQDTWDADLRPTTSNSTLHAEERRKEGKKKSKGILVAVGEERRPQAGRQRRRRRKRMVGPLGGPW